PSRFMGAFPRVIALHGRLLSARKCHDGPCEAVSSRAAATMAGRDASGDEMREAERFRNVAVQRRRGDELARVLARETDALHPKARPARAKAGGRGATLRSRGAPQGLDRAGALDEAPLPQGSA